MMITIARKTGDQVVDQPSQSYRSGALNIDLCRVDGECVKTSKGAGFGGTSLFGGGTKPREESDLRTGRWPANLLHDGSEDVLAGFPQTEGGKFKLNRDTGRTAISTTAHNARQPNRTSSICNYGDAGSASRFFKQVPQDLID